MSMSMDVGMDMEMDMGMDMEMDMGMDMYSVAAARSLSLSLS